jgi:TPR repeat protein
VSVRSRSPIIFLVSVSWLALFYNSANSLELSSSPEAILAKAQSLLEEKDIDQARIHYRHAADNGMPQAQFEYGLLLLQGIEGQNTESILGGIQYLEQAAAQSFAEAHETLARVFLEGYGPVARDNKKALASLVWLAESGSLNAQKILANILLNGKLGAIDIDEGLKHLESAGHQADPEAISLLFEFYSTGTVNVPTDAAKAGFWAKKLATTADLESLTTIGVKLLQQYESAEVATQGFGYLKRAAESNYHPANHALTRVYWNGAVGIDPDLEKALFWLDHASRHGDMNATRMLYEYQGQKPNVDEMHSYGIVLAAKVRGKEALAQLMSEVAVLVISDERKWSMMKDYFDLSRKSIRRKPSEKIAEVMNELVANGDVSTEIAKKMKYYFSDLSTNASCSNTIHCGPIEQALLTREKRLHDKQLREEEQKRKRALAAERQQKLDTAQAKYLASKSQSDQIIKGYRGNYQARCPSMPNMPYVDASDRRVREINDDLFSWRDCVEQAIQDAYALDQAENLNIKKGHGPWHPYVPKNKQRGSLDANAGLTALSRMDQRVQDHNRQIERQNRNRRNQENSERAMRRNRETNRSLRNLQRTLRDTGRKICEATNDNWRAMGIEYSGMVRNCYR